MARSVTGRERITQALLMAPGLARAAADQSLEGSALELAGAMRALARVRRGGPELKRRASSSSRRGAVRASIRVIRAQARSGAPSWRVVAGGAGSWGDAFYARFVEFGTAAGARGRRLSIGGRARKQYRTHPGSEPHPFFWPVYRLRKRAIRSKATRRVRAALKRLRASGGNP